MASTMTAEKLKGLDIKQSCKNCKHLGVCWLVPSVKTALTNHKEATGIMMFEWENMGSVCLFYEGGMNIIEDSDDMR